MRRPRSTDYDWIIYDTIYILITLTGDSREENLQAKPNKPPAFSQGLSSNGAWNSSTSHGLGFIELKKQQQEEGRGRADGLGWVGVLMEMERDGIADITW